LKKSSLWISAAAALVAAAVLAGCGKTTYFDGRVLPPSKLVNRVMIAVQNAGVTNSGELEIVDAFYDERSAYNGTPSVFTVGGFGGKLPITIQNMPEEQRGAVYGFGDGSLSIVNYQTEASSTTVSGLQGLSSSVFLTRNLNWAFAANQTTHVLTIANVPGAASISLSLPGIYRVSTNPGGSMALAFVQNSNYAYYPRQLNTSQSFAYSGGPSTWPKAAVDCEPQTGPEYCLFQVQSPDAVDATGNYYGAPLVFDHPVKAVFSNDGSTAYVLSCGPECGGVASGISLLPVAPLLMAQIQQSGLLPCNASPCANTASLPMAKFPVPGGAGNALVDGSTMYVVGQKPQVVSSQTYYGGNLSVVNLANNTVTSTTAITDGQPGAMTRMVEADDNTLWIGMSGCTNGVRSVTGQTVGCLTMYNTSTNTVTMQEPYIGNASGIAAVLGLHKVYTAEGGQVYIYSTINGASMDNQYVTVTGTAMDVAYMDAVTDADNTYY
jgi:hypothetical protein